MKSWFYQWFILFQRPLVDELSRSFLSPEKRRSSSVHRYSLKGSVYVRGTPPEWLVTGRVLGSVGLAPGDREGYEAYLETRVLELGRKAGRREWEAAWRRVRRGWYVGREEFGVGLRALAKAALGSNRRESNAGPTRIAHDQAQAQRMLEAGLGWLGVKESDLAKMPKGQAAKQVLAWWLYGRTTVTRRWLAERLKMGYETRVSQAVHWVESNRTRAVMDLRRKLTGNAI